MQFNWLLQLLGWLALPLLAALAGVLLWRKAYREFPLFFGYVLTAILATVVRWMAYRVSYKSYYFAYWTSDLLLFALGLAVTYDLFARRIFAGYHRVRFYRIAVPIAILIVIALTVAAVEMPNRTTIFLIASRVLSLLEVALVVFFGGLMLFLDRKWTDYEIGIASGFALSHCVQLMVALVRMKFQYEVTIVDQFPAWAYDVACILWIVYCRKVPEQRGVSAVPLQKEWLEEARRLEQHLRDWLSKRRCI
jgi:hypothetical protein